MTTFLAFVFVLGVLVFVHELGHFLAAKRVGVKVLKFQLGFNPTIFSFRRGDTEYGIGALPLGGYVKMAGENPDDARTGSSDEFLSKSKWERFQILIMGPAMNLLLAFLLTALVLYQGARVPVFEDEPPVVGSIQEDTPAAGVDIQPGDLIVAVAGNRVDTWEDFFIAIGSRPNRELDIELLRNGQPLTRRVTPETEPDDRFEVGSVGVLPDTHPYIESVMEGSPAQQAGLQASDVITAVNGKRMTFQTELRDEIAENPAQPLSIELLRDGQPLQLTATPRQEGDRGVLGVYISDEARLVEPGVLEAMGMSFQQNVEWSLLIGRTIINLITGETSARQLMGPVGIAQLSGETASLGWVSLFSFMGMLSLNLGLMNLLPIPVLDGGHIAIMAVEGIARRDFSIRLKEKMLLAGLVVLMTLMVTVIYNDLTRIAWIEGLMPWR
ncbi:MAG: RIP metalloprotease RseP [Vicinamibacterales bacterium]